MKNKILYLFMVLLIASCGSNKTAGLPSDISKAAASSKVTVQSILSNMEKGNYKEGEILVKFKSGVSASSSKAHQSVGATSMKRYSLVPNLEHVKLPDGVSVKDAVMKYMSDPNVEYAEPNYSRCLNVTPSDDFFVNHQQWGLFNTGQYADGTPGADIRAPFAWDITTGITGPNTVKVAVIDTGVDYTHADLANVFNPAETCQDGIDHDGNGFVNDCRGWNFVDNNNDTFDDIGHGTHVSGIIGATAHDGGMVGVMWHVRLMPLKIFSIQRQEAGGCPVPGVAGFVSDEIAAIQFAKDNGAKVVNESFGQSTFCTAEHDAIQGASNMLFVISAGNDGANNDASPQYPASYNLPNIISVAATDQNDRLASFSNFGPNTVHVGAPGVYILSAIPKTGIADSFSSLCTGNFMVDYDFCSGTSMASPHVAGLAGLLFGYYPQLTLDQIRQTIIKYVDTESESPNVGTLNDKVQSRGRINAFRSLASLLTPSNLVATALSTSQISLSWTDNAIGEASYKVERKGPSDADFVMIASLDPNSTSFTDSGLNASTTYRYRVRVTNLAPADSFPSDQASATTPATDTPPPVETSSGGGCSIGAGQNTPTAFADLAILLAPLLAIALIRRRR